MGKRLKNEVTPAVRAEIGSLFSGIREEMSSQWPKDAAVFKRYVSSPAFDKGIEIVERYDFRRPKLTEKLSDELLASYVFLLQSGDKELGRMFKELAEWQAALPKPPWATEIGESHARRLLPTSELPQVTMNAGHEQDDDHEPPHHEGRAAGV